MAVGKSPSAIAFSAICIREAMFSAPDELLSSDDPSKLDGLSVPEDGAGEEETLERPDAPEDKEDEVDKGVSCTWSLSDEKRN